MEKLALKAENIWKEYRIVHPGDNSGSLKALLNAPINRLMKKNQFNENNKGSTRFWALKDVSFEIKHGESVGVIGRNGAGKSTLLKMISRITRPSRGKLIIFERVTSLLEIGTGFNFELSGRDNVYLNGSFLGMPISEIRSKFDEIVAFSEIEEFIDTPVKYYSSGMFVRLAFSVAVHLSPELLLLDEVLSVGDAGFRRKSEIRMKELLNSGATIVLISHDMNAIKDICQRAIWLDSGSIRMDGKAENVIDEYSRLVF
ncbi:MAG: ABC transporter ATP-binding protein [Bacteroidales bacterium]